MRTKDLVRRMNVGLLMITLLILGAYIFNKWSLNNQFDSSDPEIAFEDDVLKLSVKAAGEHRLLQGVTAHDAKDGDVTESIMIESISNLLDGDQRIVTYVAFDGDKHVGRAERRIQYTDYKPIRFEMKEAIKNISLNSDWEDALAPLHAVDCIDGDISDKIMMMDYSIGGASESDATLTIELQVTNSCGDVATLSLPLQAMMNGITQANRNAEITLSEYLVYADKGKNVDLVSLIETAVVNGEAYDVENVKISTDLDISRVGSYMATYTIEEENAGATCSLVIVVEE